MLRRVGAVAALSIGSLVLSTLVAAHYGTGAAADSTAAAGTTESIAAKAVTVSTDTAARPRTEASQRTEIIAHRGDVSAGIENTPGAIAAALRNGTDAVEFDVVWTKDNVPVILHDTDLGKNTTNCTGRTFHKTYDEIRACTTKDGKRVPNLAEALAPVEDSGKKVYVHVKTRPGLGLGAKIVAAVDAYGLNRAGRAVYFNHQPKMLDELKRAGAVELGLIFFDDMADWAWTSDYSILIPFGTPVTADLVGAAQARAMGVDGMIVNDLAGAVATFG